MPPPLGRLKGPGSKNTAPLILSSEASFR